VAATAADAAPTSSTIGDAVWLALVVGSLTVAGARAHPAALLMLVGVAGLATSGPALVVAGAAAALAVAVVAVDRVPPELSMAAGALAANALVRADGSAIGDRPTLLLGTLAAGAVAMSACHRASRRSRDVTLVVGAAVVVPSLLFAGTAAIAAVLARPQLEQGIDLAREGLRLAIDAETDAARDHFTRAQDHLRSGQRHLSRPWVSPALALPVLGPNLRAVADLANAGAEVATSVVAVADAADPSVLVVGGTQIDVTALAGALPRLVQARETLVGAHRTADQVRSPWLLGPLARRVDDLVELLGDTMPRVDTLVSVAELLPVMLGADEPRSYLVLFTTPAEARGIGGFVGNWAILEVDEGRIALGSRGRAADLSALPDAGQRVLSGPQEYRDRYYRYLPEVYLVNITASPDFPTVGRVAAELYAQAGIPPVDGVVLVDPSTLAALVKLTGPVHVPDLDEPLTADTLEQYLWHEQYLSFDQVSQRVDALDHLVEVMYEQLTARPLDPRQVLDALAPMVDARRLMVWSTRAHEAGLLAELGVDGAFPRVEAGHDLLSVRTGNTNGNKIDWYLQRYVEYSADVDPATGVVQGTVTLSLENLAHDDPALPDYVIGNVNPEVGRAWNRQWVSLYTPHQLIEVRVDGVPVEAEAIPELGVMTYAVYVNIPPGSTTTLTFRLWGQLDPSSYRLLWSGQPTIRPDRLDLRIDTGRDVVEHRATTSANVTVSEHEGDHP
jgi:hypothetical protein